MKPTPAFRVSSYFQTSRNMHSTLNQFQTCLPRVQTLLSQCVPTENESHVELELRFGTLSETGHQFQPGVSQTFFESCLKLLRQFEEWKEETHEEETHDFYYQLPGDAPIRIRTSVKTEIDPVSKLEVIRTQHIHKTTRDSADFRYLGAAPFPMDLSSTVPSVMSPLVSTSGRDIRIALHLETTVPDESIPARVDQTSLVRIKNRKSFVYQNKNQTHKPTWRYDFTRTWSGQTLQLAEAEQERGNTVFEIEIECLDPVHALQHFDSLYMSLSLLMKAKDLIGNQEVFTWEPVSRF